MFPGRSLISDAGASQAGTMFQSRHVKSFATANIRGLKYGAFESNRGNNCSYAYVKGRQAAQISYILSVSIPQSDLPPLEANLVIIRRFKNVADPPVMPWSLWCVQ